MKADFRVCLDSCVLANFGVADLLLKLAARGGVGPLMNANGR
jgi:hypothetical protein